MSRLIGITGHANLESPFGEPYVSDQYNSNVYSLVFNDLESFLNSQGDVICCCGMARGVDEIFALVAIKLNLPLITCIPSSVEWHKNLKVHPIYGRAQALKYETILSYTGLIRIIEVEPGNTKMDVFNKRNQVIVDEVDEVYSYHIVNSIGTQDCITKARLAEKYRGNIYNPSTHLPSK